MRKILVHIILVACLLTAGCKDDDDGEAKFEGIHLRDLNNIDMGTLGKRDLNDWENDGTLSENVLALLATTPDHDLSGTSDADITIAGGYPNPANNSFTFQANVTGGPCLFEYVIVNEKMNVLFSGSNIGDDQAITFDVSDADKFPSNTVIRMYYSFSTEESRNFYVGHGDVLICHSTCRDLGN